MPDSKLLARRDVALLSADDVYKALDSSRKGLTTTTQSVERRACFSVNLLPQLPTTSVWKRFLQQFRDLAGGTVKQYRIEIFDLISN
jgi:magnesium-transporting ATPase (P-type)